MKAGISLAVSALVLALSPATAWLTLFLRGEARTTQPTVVFFGGIRVSGDGTFGARAMILAPLAVALQRVKGDGQGGQGSR